MDLLRKVLGFIYQHFTLFLIIVAIFVIGNALLKEYKSIDDIGSQIAILRETDAHFELHFPELIASLKAETIGRINQLHSDLQNVSVTTLDARISSIDSQKVALKNSQCSLRKKLRNTKKCLIGDAESDIRIAILEQERPYIATLRDNAKTLNRLAKNEAEIERAKTIQIACRMESDRLEITFLESQLPWATNRSAQKELRKKHPIKVEIHGTGPNKRMRKLEDEEKRLVQEKDKSYAIFDAKRKECNAIVIPKKISEVLSSIVPMFEVDLDKFRAPILSKIAELESILSANWLQRLRHSVEAVLPMAAITMASIIFTPFVIKVLLYFFVAPIASRRTSNALLPESSGKIDGFSMVGDPIDIAIADELIVHPDYVLLTPKGGAKDTKWLLHNRYPLSSIASNMYALTRFRNDVGGAYGIAPMKNPLAKLAMIAIPDGSAFVLHPHCLIGIVQRRDHPMAISRHWRLGSVHAWLTLQLRYLVFHGPVTLIVEGCGGVSMGQAGTGENVNQAATIGFSANLPYAITRAEPFFAYLSGTQELFNDTFPSGSGYFVYENTPHFEKKTNAFFGRGPEGILDSILKLFGL